MSSLSPFDFLSYDLFRWFVDEYLCTGPLFQLILLQFVCKRLKNEVLHPRSRGKVRIEDLRNTAPVYRRKAFTKIGAETCRHKSVSVARWFRCQLHFPLDVTWCYEAARGKHLLYRTVYYSTNF